MNASKAGGDLALMQSSAELGIHVNLCSVLIHNFLSFAEKPVSYAKVFNTHVCQLTVSLKSTKYMYCACVIHHH